LQVRIASTYGDRGLAVRCSPPDDDPPDDDVEPPELLDPPLVLLRGVLPLLLPSRSAGRV
jgi:hypothetical protein